MKVKQIIALVVVIALLMTGSVLVTFAYLTREAQVTNTFTVGDIQMKLDESKVDLYGRPLTAEGKIAGKSDTVARHAEGNEYKLIPSHTYTKDPIVTIEAGSEPCYVRMMVTVTDYEDLCDVLGKGNMEGDVFLLQNFVQGWKEAEWPCQINTIDIDKENNQATYEFRYYTTVDATVLDDEGNTNDVVLPALFTGFSIPGDVLVNSDDVLAKDLADLAELEIQIKAHAIQSDGFATAEAAWDTWVD